MMNQTSRPRVRVGIVDDHALVREGLRLVLGSRPEIEVVGEADDRSSAFALTAEQRPDVLLLDVTLGDDDAIPMIGALKARHPDVRVVMVTMHSDAETTRQALANGAEGYVVKGARSGELVDAVLAVARGDRYLHSAVAGGVVDDSMRWLRHSLPLTSREREILRLFAAGLGPTQIGATLNISANTVRRHLANIGEKVGAHGRAGLTRYASEHGLLAGLAIRQRGA